MSNRQYTDPHSKQCCCCGGEAGRWRQWHNRDTGYGICARCAASEWTSRPFGRPIDKAHFFSLYGEPGIHFQGSPEILEGWDFVSSGGAIET